jgi:hypothetical protein
MPTRDGDGGENRLDRLEVIEQLLVQYRTTKDRRLLRRAIELWDQVQAERLLTTTRRYHIH